MKIDDVEVKSVKGYSQYYAGANGLIYRVSDNTWTRKANDGMYALTTLVRDDGEKIRWPVHRFIAYAFLGDPPEHISGRKIINHLNGIKNDNRPENLEWTNDLGNIEHAGRLKLSPKCTPVSVHNPVTKETLHFPSYIKAGRYLGLNKDMMKWRLDHGEDRLYPEGFQYRKTDINNPDKPWAKIRTDRHGPSRRMLSFDLKEKKEQCWNSASDFERFLNLPQSTIASRLWAGAVAPVKGRYLVKWEDDDRDWPDISEPLLIHGVYQPIVVIHSETNDKRVFVRARDCAKVMGLLPTTLNMRLKSGKKDHVWPDGYRYYYLKDFTEKTKSES